MRITGVLINFQAGDEWPVRLDGGAARRTGQLRMCRTRLRHGRHQRERTGAGFSGLQQRVAESEHRPAVLAVSVYRHLRVFIFLRSLSHSIRHHHHHHHHHYHLYFQF